MKNLIMFTMLAIIMAICDVNLAFAGEYAWGKTKWGMTLEQVNKAVGKKFNFFKKEADGGEIYAVDNYKIGEQLYRVTAIFYNKKLEKVLLSAKGSQTEMKKSCTDVFGAIKKRVGRGNSSVSTSDVTELKWRTDETNIALLCMSDIVMVSYEKVKNDGSSPF